MEDMTDELTDELIDQMPAILTGETKLKVKEVHVAWEDEGLSFDTVGRAAMHCPGSFPVYGIDFAMYTPAGDVLPSEKPCPVGDYLIATRLPVEFKSKPGLGPGVSIVCKAVEGLTDLGISRPRSKSLFDISAKPRERWCWMVESRRLLPVPMSYGEATETEVWGDWSDWNKLKSTPYGFGDRVSALRRQVSVMRSDEHNIQQGIVEYRVRPHYLGYIPSDEPWYAKSYAVEPIEVSNE